MEQRSPSHLENTRNGQTACFYAVLIALITCCGAPQRLLAQDLIAPSLTAVAVAPTDIDVTAGSAQVTVKVSVTDNLSGFWNGYIRFASPSGHSRYVHLSASNRISGDALSGIYEVQLTFAQYSEPGSWVAVYAYMQDTTTNFHVYDAAELISLGFDATIEVTSPSDTIAPEVTGLDLVPSSVDLGSGPATVSISLTVTDDHVGFNSGFSRAYIYAFNPSYPALRQHRVVVVNSTHLASGDDLNGTYKTTVMMPQYGEVGDWTLRILLWDNSETMRTYDDAALASLGFPAYLTVLPGTQDITAPELAAFTLGPQLINTVLSPDSTTFTARTTDDLAGFNYAQFGAISPSGGQHHGMYFSNASGALISGDAHDGTYELTKSFPRYSEYGEWTINYFTLYDKIGNRLHYSTQALFDLGYDTSILMEGAIPGGGGVYTISADGGFIQTDDGGMTMSFPPGALPEETDITVTQVGRHEEVNIYVGTGDEPGRGTVLGEYNFEPDGLQFGEPVTVTMTIDVTALNEQRCARLDVYLFTDTDDDGVLDTFVPLADEQIVSIVTTAPDAEGNVYMIYTVLLEHFSDYAVIEEIVEAEDTTPPLIEITSPYAAETVQDTITMLAEASDESGVDEVHCYVREVDDGQGVVGGHEEMPAAQRGASDEWELALDSTELLDGCYLAFATASDVHGNMSTSEPVEFTIRNWTFMELLPDSDSYNAGRTMPVKFSIRVDENVDPSQSFVRNEELEVVIYETSVPGDLLQVSYFGDASKDYRISAEDELYITNFKTSRTPSEYTVEIKCLANDLIIASFEFETN